MIQKREVKVERYRFDNIRNQRSKELLISRLVSKFSRSGEVNIIDWEVSGETGPYVILSVTFDEVDNVKTLMKDISRGKHISPHRMSKFL